MQGGRDCADIAAPGQSRCTPYLPRRTPELPALANGAQADRIGCRRIRVCRIDWRTADGTEGLRAAIAAVRHLDINRWLTRQFEISGERRNGRTIRRARQCLAVRAVAQDHAGGIDFGRKGYLAAMAFSFDIQQLSHVIMPFFQPRADLRAKLPMRKRRHCSRWFHGLPRVRKSHSGMPSLRALSARLS